MKIIQIITTENTEKTQGNLLGLGDDGVVYVHSDCDWVVYAKPVEKDGVKCHICSKKFALEQDGDGYLFEVRDCDCNEQEEIKRLKDDIACLISKNREMFCLIESSIRKLNTGLLSEGLEDLESFIRKCTIYKEPER